MLRILRALLLVAMLPVGVASELPKVDLPNVGLPTSAGNLLLIRTPTGGLKLNPSGSDALIAPGTCTDLAGALYAQQP